jgi:hypothetical protein
MTTKLTLTLDDKVIRSAKKYASRKGKSLSKMVEVYLKNVSSDDTTDNNLSQRVIRLKGVIRLPKDFDYKNELSKQLSSKYNKR